MKKEYLLIMLVLYFGTTSNAQENREKILKDVVYSASQIKYPIRAWSYYYYGTYDNDTYLTWTLLSKNQYNELLCKQGISCKSITPYCKDDSFKGFTFGGILSHPFSTKFWMLEFTYYTETGCGERGFLATFTPQGDLIDTLIYYGNYSTEYSCGGIIEKDSIMVIYSKNYPKGLKSESWKEFDMKTPYVIKIYGVNTNGKFVEKHKYLQSRKTRV